MLFCFASAIVHTHDMTAAPAHVEPEGPVVLAEKMLSLSLLHMVYIKAEYVIA